MSIAKAEALRSAEKRRENFLDGWIGAFFESLYIEGEVNDVNRRSLP